MTHLVQTFVSEVWAQVRAGQKVAAVQHSFTLVQPSGKALPGAQHALSEDHCPPMAQRVTLLVAAQDCLGQKVPATQQVVSAGVQPARGAPSQSKSEACEVLAFALPLLASSY